MFSPSQISLYPSKEGGTEGAFLLDPAASHPDTPGNISAKLKNDLFLHKVTVPDLLQGGTGVPEPHLRGDLGPVRGCSQRLLWQGSSISLVTAKCGGTGPAALSQGPAITAATCTVLTRWSHCPAALPPQGLLAKILLLLLDKEPSLHWSLHYFDLSDKDMASLEAVPTGELLTPYDRFSHQHLSHLYSFKGAQAVVCDGLIPLLFPHLSTL